jgi:hypothetical protein
MEYEHKKGIQTILTQVNLIVKLKEASPLIIRLSNLKVINVSQSNLLNTRPTKNKTYY